MASLRFRHFISGSLVFVSIGAYLTKSRFAFSRNAHHHGFSPTAACGGLEPPPVWRLRRALPHLRLSMASGLSARLPSWRTVVGKADKRRFALEARLAADFEPAIEHVMEVDVR